MLELFDGKLKGETMTFQSRLRRGFRVAVRSAIPAAILACCALLPAEEAKKDAPADGDNPFGEVKTAPKEEAKPTKPAETPAPKPVPPGAKSLDEYRDLLRRHSLMREYDKVLELCVEVEKFYPGEDIILLYRSRAQKGIEDEKTKQSMPFKGLRERPVVLDTPAPVETPKKAAPTPQTETAPQPKAAEETTKPDQAQPAGAPQAAEAPAPAKGKSAGKLIALGLAVIGVIVIGLGALMASRKKKTPAEPAYFENPEEVSSSPGLDSSPDLKGWERMNMPPSHPVQPAPVAPPMRQAAPIHQASAQPAEEELFSPSGKPSAPVASATTSILDADIFASPEPTGKEQGIAREAHPIGTKDEELFAAFQEEKPAGTKTGAKASPRPTDTSSGPIAFDTPVAKGKPAAPWEEPKGADTTPPIHLETSQPAAAKAPEQALPPVAPWETDAETVTNRPLQADEVGDDSLPLIAPEHGKVFSASKFASDAPPQAPPMGDFAFPTVGSKESRADSTAAPFAEVSLKGIRSPETAETIANFEVPLAGDTHPGFEIPTLGKESGGAPEEKPDLSLPSMPIGESTVVLSSRQLAEDPDLLLSKPRSEKAKEAPAKPQENVQVFRADETIQVSFGEVAGATPPTEAKKPESPEPAAKDNFDRERDLGMKAVNESNWEQAILHLSIAAALRPDASEVKEQLRRARRMRKEQEGS